MKKPAYDYDAFLEKLRKKEKSGALYRLLVQQEEPVLSYAVKKPAGWDSDWEVLDDWIHFWADVPKDRSGRVLYAAELAPKHCGHLGKYNIPTHVTVASAEDAFALLGMEKEKRAFLSEYQMLLREMPSLAEWFLAFYVRIRAEDFLPAARAMAECFREGVREGRFLREMSIRGVDTKFLEKHTYLVRMLWNELYPEDAAKNWDELAEKWKTEGEPVPQIGVRFLDVRQSMCGVRRLFLAAEDMEDFRPEARHVFITENKVNGYTFPEAEESLVLFGMGYGVVEMARHAAWLQEKDVWYWGDLDSDGFLILSKLREILPEVHSFLMTKDVLRACEPDIVKDTGTRTAIPQRLTMREKALWKELSENGQRLEQERVPRTLVEKAVDEILWERPAKDGEN